MLFVADDWLQLVQGAVDIHQLIGFPGPEIAPSRTTRDGGQGRLVQIRRWVDAHRSIQPPHHGDIGTDADGVDSQAQFGGEACRVHGMHLAGGVGAVGEKNENAILGGSFTQAFDAEPYGIADCRLFAG